jgi:hypothetical protein
MTADLAGVAQVTGIGGERLAGRERAAVVEVGRIERQFFCDDSKPVLL